jgi:hypothetical protein
MVAAEKCADKVSKEEEKSENAFKKYHSRRLPSPIYEKE